MRRSVLMSLAGLALAATAANVDAQDLTCMVCEEAMIEGEIYHGFWPDSEWLCEGGGGGTLVANGNSLMDSGTCNACSGESDCHTIHPPTQQDPYGRFRRG
jgi:hypothetical protein